MTEHKLRIVEVSHRQHQGRCLCGWQSNVLVLPSSVLKEWREHAPKSTPTDRHPLLKNIYPKGDSHS
jgi:hypothetical protein